jgi:hypothetical protein
MPCSSTTGCCPPPATAQNFREPCAWRITPEIISSPSPIISHSPPNPACHSFHDLLRLVTRPRQSPPPASDWAAHSHPHRLPGLFSRRSHHKGTQLRVNSLCGSIAPQFNSRAAIDQLTPSIISLVSAPVTRPTGKIARAYRKGTVWTRLGARLRHSRNPEHLHPNFFLLSCPRASSLH